MTCITNMLFSFTGYSHDRNNRTVRIFEKSLHHYTQSDHNYQPVFGIDQKNFKTLTLGMEDSQLRNIN